MVVLPVIHTVMETQCKSTDNTSRTCVCIHIQIDTWQVVLIIHGSITLSFINITLSSFQAVTTFGTGIGSSSSLHKKHGELAKMSLNLKKAI